MKRLAIFAHYDDRGEVKRYILHHLRGLREVCDAVWFVSTAQLSDGELDKVRPTCGRAWLRENVGYDFGMWQDAFRDPAVCSWDELVLANSSVYGPIWPLSDVFSKMAENADCDFWGMTDCTEIAWHIQSYFLVFRECLVRSTVLRDFFVGLDLSGTKRAVIERCEIGLTSYLLGAGYRGKALVTCAEIPRPLYTRIRRPHFNPTISTPMTLTARRMPYVKVELLRDNPLGVRLGPLFDMIAASGYDRSLLEHGPSPAPRTRRGIRGFPRRA